MYQFGQSATAQNQQDASAIITALGNKIANTPQVMDVSPVREQVKADAWKFFTEQSERQPKQLPIPNTCKPPSKNFVVSVALIFMGLGLALGLLLRT